MNNCHKSNNVFTHSRAVIIIFILILSILSSLTTSCGAPQEPAPAPTPPPQIPLKPIPESTPAPSPSPTPSTSPTPSFKTQTGSTINLEELETNVGEIGSVEINITGLTNGISGYDLTVSLENNAIAEIVDVELPDFGLPDVKKISSSEVTIRAVDLKDIIPSGKAQALLATLRIQGIRLGTTNINVVINAMDDDDGNPMESHVNTSVIKVADTNTAPAPKPTIKLSDITQKSTVIGRMNSYQVAISPDGMYVLVGDEKQNVVTFASSDGKVLWENALTEGIEMESGAIASNGSLIVVGGQGSTVFAFSREGRLLWQADLSGELQAAVTDTGERVFAAGRRSLSAYDHDGRVLWSQEISTREWSIWGISTTPDGSRILLRTNSDILLLDGKGKENGWFDVVSGNHLVSASLSHDGEQFVVGFVDENTHYVALYSVDSGEIWRQTVENYADVDLDDRGSVFATTKGGNSYIWDNEGNLLTSWPDGGLNIGVARDGKTCIVGDWSKATIYSVKWD